MVPTLKEFCISDRQPVGQLAYYKQAFDCLRLKKPEINDKTLRILRLETSGAQIFCGGKTVALDADVRPLGILVKKG